ncbi:uncharacterized protein LOC128234165 isoform X2 [Mya arenaria]|nr:uncharacterized protein LOC128234165 isoform X2 [Mya arenaria]
MERTTLKLFCESQSNPKSSFSWTGSNIMQTGSVLLRNNISRLERGHMSCTAKNTMTHIDQPVEGLSSANITLNILYSPQLHQLPGVSALEGENLTLKCEYEPGNPTETTVGITRLNDRITWTERTHFIPSLKRSDAGMYSYTVRNIMKPTGQQNEIVGEDTGIFQVNVWYKTSVTKFGLTSHPDAINVTVDENTTLNFYCKVDSNPSSTISFGKSDRIQNNTTLKRNYGFLHLAFDVQQAGCFDTARFTKSIRRSMGKQHYRGTTYYQVHNSDKYTVSNAGGLTTFTINAIEQEYFSTYLLTVSNGISPDFNKIFNLRPQEPPPGTIGSIVGGTTAGIVAAIILVIVVVFVLRRKYNFDCLCSFRLSRKDLYHDAHTDNGIDTQGADNRWYNASQTYEDISMVTDKSMYDTLNNGDNG